VQDSGNLLYFSIEEQKAVAKTKRGKVRDKWAQKKWLAVQAPPSFGNSILTTIPVTDEDKAVGRVIETTLFDILREDPQHYNIKLYFQVSAVVGGVAHTIFKGHEYAREFLKSLVRRGSSMVELIRDYSTADGAKVRIYVSVFTYGRINASRKRAIRSAADKVLRQRTGSLTYDEFTREVVLEKMASDVRDAAEKVVRLRHVGIRKTKLIQQPKQLIPTAPVPEAGATA